MWGRELSAMTSARRRLFTEKYSYPIARPPSVRAFFRQSREPGRLLCVSHSLRSEHAESINVVELSISDRRNTALNLICEWNGKKESLKCRSG